MRGLSFPSENYYQSMGIPLVMDVYNSIIAVYNIGATFSDLFPLIPCVVSCVPDVVRDVHYASVTVV